MEEILANPDFGSGLSLDEVVGMTAKQMSGVTLPKGEVYQTVQRAADLMLRAGLGCYVLEEVWADGHTVWHGIIQHDPVIVTPYGYLIRE